MATEQDKKLVIKSAIPVVPFKGVGFFDIGGLLADPTALQYAFDLLAASIAPFIDEIDAIGCFDARGFLFGPWLGTHFHKKVFLLRKPGKMPSVAHTIEYAKEYSGDDGSGLDQLSVQASAVTQGTRVLLVDDLLATGGTAGAGVRLVQQAGGSVTGCLFVIEIDGLPGREAIAKAAPGLDKSRIISLLVEKE